MSASKRLGMSLLAALPLFVTPAMAQYVPQGMSTTGSVLFNRAGTQTIIFGGSNIDPQAAQAGQHKAMSGIGAYTPNEPSQDEVGKSKPGEEPDRKAASDKEKPRSSPSAQRTDKSEAVNREQVANVPQTLRGHAVAESGSELEIGGQRVSLYGLIAPEASAVCYLGPSTWRCGSEATQTLQSLLDQGTTVCEVSEVTSTNQVKAACTVGNTDASSYMAQSGMAKSANPSLSRDVAIARADHRGLWVGQD